MALKLLGRRPLTAEILIDSTRVLTPIVRCHLCGTYGYLANRVNASADGHADIKLSQLPVMIVRKTTKEGHEYDSTCMECITNRMYPDDKLKEAKK